MEQDRYPQLLLKLFRVSQLGIGMLVAASSAWQAVDVAKRSSLFVLPVRWQVVEVARPAWLESLPRIACRIIRPVYPAIHYSTVLLVDLHDVRKNRK